MRWALYLAAFWLAVLPACAGPGGTDGGRGGTGGGPDAARTGSPTGGSAAGAGRRELPRTWYGVTLADVRDLAAIRASLAALPRRPIARVVFDRGMAPGDYATAVRELHPVSFLLGQPVDSSDVPAYGVRDYALRYREYVAALGGQIDVWEVGNEVNGEWLGSIADVTAKLSRAFDEVRAGGGRTALTLYYNPRCHEKPSHDMFTWAERHVPPRIRHHLDYLLVSYYEHDCGGHRPDQAEWAAVFDRLGRIFPTARLGFGEVGADPQDTMANRQRYLDRYYRLRLQRPGFLGGYFWWYYAEDMVPHAGNPLWATLAAAIAQAPESP